MDAWIDIRRKARVCHAKALAVTNGDRRAEKIIEAALKADRLEVETCEFAPGTLGSLSRAFRLVRVQKNLKLEDEHVVIAHEIGHFHLHHDPHNEVTVRPHGLGGDPVDSGAGQGRRLFAARTEGSSSGHLRRRISLPGRLASRRIRCQETAPAKHRERTWTAPSLVMNQMVRALVAAADWRCAGNPAGGDA